jgi:hypothetical protein
MQSEELFASVFTIGMFMGVFIIYMGLRQRSEQLQMRHRERMAMIEKGQIPLNETPGEWDRQRQGSPPSSMSLSIGIIVVGIGLALATMLSLAADSPEIGLGIGGAVAIIGAAFIARSVLVRPPASPEPPRTIDRLD